MDAQINYLTQSTMQTSQAHAKKRYKEKMPSKIMELNDFQILKIHY